MSKKKSPHLRINFGLVENNIPANAISSVTQLIDFNSAKRLFDAEEKFNAQNESKAAIFSEKGFSEVYDALEESEKSLYRIWYIDVADDTDVNEVLEEIRNDPNVEFAEIDELNTLYYTPNDPLYPQLYGLKLMDSECAWNTSKGEDIIIAVLDTGVNYKHPDIANNMWQDTNGNYGYDFSDDDSDPIDYHGHGTHCAGTIAATGNNNKGIIGVAPKAKIMAVKIFPNAFDSKIAKALKYAVDNGAKILSNSWGPRNRRASAPVLEAAVRYVHSKGGVCVFAAGNSNDDTQYYSPANMKETITVGASDSNDERASFSNYGNTVDIAAPGVSILSLRHNNSGYRTMSGTSMACPHIAGAVALLLKKTPHLSYNQILNQLKTTSDSIKPDRFIGDGRINVCKMLQ